MSDEPEMPTRAPLPLHAAVLDADGRPLRVHRRPGRPRRAKPAPDCSEREYIETLNAARVGHVARDPVLRALRDGSPADRVLQETVRAIARESASIAFEVHKATVDGGQTETLHARRLDGLVKIASIVLDRMKWFEPEIPMHKLERIAAMWVSMIDEAAETTMPPDVREVFAGKIKKAMTAWLTTLAT
jgi:hypothetical protein